MKDILVKRLPRNPGPAAWNSILPPVPAGPRLESVQTADWIIIGGGFAGLSAAARLVQKRPNDKVVVLEAAGIAEGASGRNSGFMIDLPHDLSSEDYGGQADADAQTIRHNRAAIDFARGLVGEYGITPEAFREVGKINGAATEKGHQHNRDYAEHLAKIGEASTLMDAQQMREVTGIPYYHGGLFTPGTVMLQPALYVRELAAGLRARGVGVYENSPVAGLRQAGPDWTATTAGGAVTAPRVIMATNGHIENFGFYKHSLIHIFLFGSFSRTLSDDEMRKLGGDDDWGITPADPMGTTVRKISGIGGNRLLVRNRFSYDPKMYPSERVQQKAWRDHDRAFKARFGHLGEIGIEYRWGGQLCLSWNNVAAFGEVDSGVYSAACQNGLGTVKGTLHGMAAVDQAIGDTGTIVNELLAAPAPVRLPPDPFATIGARARIAWGEMTAGREK